MCAAMIDDNETLERSCLFHSNPLALGVDLGDGKMFVLVPTNGTLPCNVTVFLTIQKHGPLSIPVLIFEGEDQLCANNHMLGKFIVSGFEPGRHRQTIIELTINFDENGNAQITAGDNETRRQLMVDAVESSHRFSGQQWRQWAKKQKAKFENHSVAAEAKFRLEQLIRFWEIRLLTSVFYWPEDMKEAGFTVLDRALAWVDAHGNEPADEYTLKIQDLQNELRKVLFFRPYISTEDLENI
jgi:molecular chaperone DnaK (HSP70)